MNNQKVAFLLLIVFLAVYGLNGALPDTFEFSGLIYLLLLFLPGILWWRNRSNRRKYIRCQEKLKEHNLVYQEIPLEVEIFWHPTRTVTPRFNHPVTLNHFSQKRQAQICYSNDYLILLIQTKHWWGYRLHRPLIVRRNLETIEVRIFRPNAQLRESSDLSELIPDQSYPDISKIEWKSISTMHSSK
ncbi:hypothetical protein KFE98_19520 [bacterium SCSIO 12741]|nr:hypothetical protein KFE98_19520 [bacterium SCSIO 12741]